MITSDLSKEALGLACLIQSGRVGAYDSRDYEKVLRLLKESPEEEAALKERVRDNLDDVQDAINTIRQWVNT
jgi:hypothetical protein